MIIFRASTLVALFGLAGCVAGNRPNVVRTGAESMGKTFYLDGAGNFGFGKESIPRGLADSGYQGNVEHFIWTTHLGPVVDQVSVDHNRRAARALTQKIERYLRAHPGARINLIALSAGTGVAVFAPEQLSPDARVNDVILLSSSLSSSYDLTQALRHVTGEIYFFWSPKDPVLNRMVPIVGTVDRSKGGAAGLYGAIVPAAASAETKKLYARVRNVRWDADSLKRFIKLRHAGTVSREFIRDYVAPIVLGASPFTAIEGASFPPKGENVPSDETRHHNE